MKTTNRNTSILFTDKVAVKLARLIITIQFRSANWLNQKFNTCSTRAKKRIMIVCGLLAASVLLAGSFTSFYTIPKLSQNYNATHIGLPSDPPKPPFTKRQLTDSLTKKK